MLITNYIISFKFIVLLLMLGEITGTGQNRNLFASTSVEPDYHNQTTDVLVQTPRARSQRRRMVRGYYKARITPNWFHDKKVLTIGVVNPMSGILGLSLDLTGAGIAKRYINPA